MIIQELLQKYHELRAVIWRRRDTTEIKESEFAQAFAELFDFIDFEMRYKAPFEEIQSVSGASSKDDTLRIWVSKHSSISVYQQPDRNSRIVDYISNLSRLIVLEQTANLQPFSRIGVDRWVYTPYITSIIVEIHHGVMQKIHNTQYPIRTVPLQLGDILAVDREWAYVCGEITYDSINWKLVYLEEFDDYGFINDHAFTVS